MCCYFLPPIPIAAREPLEKRPRATYWIVGINAGIWMTLNLLNVLAAFDFVPSSLPEKIVLALAFTPEDRYPWSYITSAFTQEGLFHLVSNIFFLWMFGSFLEEKIGWKKYVALLLVGGAVGCFAHDLVLKARGLEEMRDLPLIGASGIVFTILGAFLFLMPSMEFRCFYIVGILWHWTFDTIMIPAAIYIPVWVMVEQVVSFFGDSGSAISYSAHLGGFATGMLGAAFIRFRPKREKTVRLEQERFRKKNEEVANTHYENFKRALDEENPTVALALVREAEKRQTPLPLAVEDKLELGAQLVTQGEYSVPKRIYLQMLSGELGEETRLEVSLRLCRILITFERDLESSKELLRTLYRRYRENDRIGEINRMVEEVKQIEANMFKRPR
jgi:membrane associated rhomboid family serine protease